jgi:excinuclease ABC subunit C
MSLEPKNRSTAAPQISEQKNILVEKLHQVSQAPGVYLFKDADGKILYVGKARNLRKRLSSYFNRPAAGDTKTYVLVGKIKAFETILTRSEKEALILEANLIKRHRPRYNVMLKDGKRYPSLCLDLAHPYPNLSIVRKTHRKDVMYFGPYASAHAVRQTLKIVNKIFKLRKCKNREFSQRTRPCLHYQMDACLGPCTKDVEPAVYREMVKEVILFLKGRTPQLIGQARKDMLTAAQKQEYERAAVLRDKIVALERTLEKQVAVTTDFKDRDAFGLARTAEASVVTLIVVRGGYILGTRHFKLAATLDDDGELLETILRQYYKNSPFIPKEIVVPLELEDASMLEENLSEQRGSKVSIHRPQRGEKVRLIEMATLNAEGELQRHLADRTAGRILLTRLQKRLGTATLPARIECFDNSNIAGSDPVAAMVVFENGRPNPDEYRKYRIRSVVGPDDYASMAEVMQRRYGKADASVPFPDLLMLDGGKGQLNIVLEILKKLDLPAPLDVIALAKKNEARRETMDKVYKPDRSNPVNLGPGEELLLFLQQIRDEAHRFAIAFHRKRRSKSAVRSVLDNIPGIGSKRKRQLLYHFGTIGKIRTASPDELAGVPGMNRATAAVLLKHLK